MFLTGVQWSQKVQTDSKRFILSDVPTFQPAKQPSTPHAVHRVPT